jgi:glycosyltransferase involved in cell wall biosynthesis
MKSDISPRVSIVIACFNYARYVALAIRSALEQTLPPLEVVVVDDGSTDGTAALLSAFGDRIRTITQENKGQIEALNRGYAACHGDLVLFLDADDLLRPTALASVVEAWTPLCAKVQFELDVIDGAGDPLGRRFCNYVEPYGAAEVRREFSRFGTYVWPVLSGNVYSRWFLRRFMPLRKKIFADGLLNTLAPLYGDVQVIPRPLGCYRLHGANQSYHGTTTSQIGVRFAKQVELRRSELRLLAEHAAKRSVRLPPGNLLDHELTFVNYRLMLKKLGLGYEGAAGERASGLWRAGVLAILRRPLPARLKCAHAIWLTALVCSPPWPAYGLIALRFNRAVLMQPLRGWCAKISGTATRA